MATSTVLVVGAGPVGLMMAAELARFGVPVRVIDKAAARTDKSKAIVLWPRTLELLERAGCSAAFVEAGFKVNAANLIAGGEPRAHILLNEVRTPYPFALMLPQSDTERLLEEHLNRLGVTVERDVELARFSPGEANVSATLRHPNAREETVTADWLIGCDGAHSSVRHGLGVEFSGSTLSSSWILADVHLAGRAAPENELDIYLHAAGTLLFFPLSSTRFRIIADVSHAPSDQAGSAPSLSDVQAIIDQRGPGGILASQPVWLGGFTINERMVRDYRAGRVLLAGDAAHVHSPAGGQGMNTGMQDAINLAWKLALVTSGTAKESLLDSYSIERSKIARQVLSDAGSLTTLGTIKGTLAQSIRNQVMSLVFGFSAVHRAMTNKLTELAVAYPDSPLTQADTAVHGGPSPGARVPPDSGRSLVVSKRPRFTLCARATPESAALIAQHPALLEPELHAPFEGDGIWLVRPDGYVALTAAASALQRVDDYLRGLHDEQA